MTFLGQLWFIEGGLLMLLSFPALATLVYTLVRQRASLRAAWQWWSCSIFVPAAMVLQVCYWDALYHRHGSYHPVPPFDVGDRATTMANAGLVLETILVLLMPQLRRFVLSLAILQQLLLWSSATGLIMGTMDWF